MFFTVVYKKKIKKTDFLFQSENLQSNSCRPSQSCGPPSQLLNDKRRAPEPPFSIIRDHLKWAGVYIDLLLKGEKTGGII